MVADADFLRQMVKNFPNTQTRLKKFKHLILTPHRMEFAQMYKSIMGQEIEPSFIDGLIESSEIVKKKEDIVSFDLFSLSPQLRQFYQKFEFEQLYLVIKGKYDLVISNQSSFVVKNPSSLKRCGGQGDILVGLTSLFGFWASEKHLPIDISLAWACQILRAGSLKAFQKHKLSVLAPQILEEVAEIINALYDEKVNQKF